MTTRIPSSLKWLIDKRARIDAEIQKTKKAISKIQEMLGELDQVEATLAALDKTFELHEINIDIALIDPVRSQYFRIKLPHGELQKLVLACFRNKEKGTQLLRSEVTEYVISRIPPEVINLGSRSQIASAVSRCLVRLYHKGILDRHHNPVTSKEGIWSLSEVGLNNLTI